MADHTKEPWLCDKRTVYALNKNGFDIFSAVVQDCRTRNSELEENARRIVACVNWCEGNSTEGMELAVKIGRPYSVERDECAKVEKQRDELLKIAEDVIGMLENCSVESGVCHCGDDMARHSSAMSCGHAPVDIGSTYAAHLYEKARAAIASVKGGE